VRRVFLLPVDFSSRPTLPATVSQLLALYDHLQICGRQNFASALETDENRSGADQGATQNVPNFFTYEIQAMKTYAMTDSRTPLCYASKQSVGRDSSVGNATHYGLDSPGIESRWEAKFSAPVQTGPGAQTASCTMGTGSLSGQ
jgi:hypothetical protein